MTLNDRNNLRFLMKSAPEQLAEWYRTASADDIEYAMELLTAARNELMVNEMKAMDRELKKLDRIIDVSDAKTLLSKFTLH